MGKEPLARTDGLLTEHVDEDLLVYDSERDTAFRLNSTAALVWQSCDGTRTAGDLRAILTGELGDLASEDMLLMALDELAEHDLIVSGYERREADAVRLSRRRFFRSAGMAGAAAAAAPLVYSMVVPASAAAAPAGSPHPI
jgi:hypothetical protein